MLGERVWFIHLQVWSAGVLVNQPSAFALLSDRLVEVDSRQKLWGCDLLSVNLMLEVLKEPDHFLAFVARQRSLLLNGSWLLQLDLANAVLFVLISDPGIDDLLVRNSDVAGGFFEVEGTHV